MPCPSAMVWMSSISPTISKCASAAIEEPRIPRAIQGKAFPTVSRILASAPSATNLSQSAVVLPIRNGGETPRGARSIAPTDRCRGQASKDDPRSATRRRAILATEPSLNQGNSAKSTNSSRSPSRIQNPCGEMFVTSTARSGSARLPPFHRATARESSGESCGSRGSPSC